MSNIMNVEEIRSVSRFGLSVVTVVFKESVPILDARQLINEQIQTVAGEIPPELGTPEMMSITTGLGEIYQYTLDVAPGYEERYDAMELRTIQDWIVKRQLSGIPGIVEINSFGGYLKQYEVAVDPDALYSLNITIGDVFEALSRNNQNTGGSYIEKVNRAYYIRSEGMISSLDDIRHIVVANRGGIPIHVSDVGTVKFGSAKRFGAMTRDGKGECVGGIAMMLKGANANVVTRELESRVAKIQKMLPEGVSISPYLNRSELVNRNISTVIRNLIEGAIIVFVVLIVFLGNVRAGLIVASVIPLAMLFAFILMRVFGVSANLMSLGAIDFGIVVDGSIVIVEGILAHLYSRQNLGRKLSHKQMDEQIIAGAGNVVRSATFAVIIILIVFFPILTLTGIEGKYFTPMAKTLVFCIIGALFLSLTYVPMMASLFLKRRIHAKPTFADRFFVRLNRIYQRCLAFCLRFSWGTMGVAVAAFAGSLLLFTRLGAEFIPTLDEGDFAMQMTLPAGSSLTRSIAVSEQAEKILMDNYQACRGQDRYGRSADGPHGRGGCRRHDRHETLQGVDQRLVARRTGREDEGRARHDTRRRIQLQPAHPAAFQRTDDGCQGRHSHQALRRGHGRTLRQGQGGGPLRRAGARRLGRTRRAGHGPSAARGELQPGQDRPLRHQHRGA